MTEQNVVSREEWLVARKAHLAKEKALTRQRDALLAERKELPWTRVDSTYLFDTTSGKKTLADLFEDKKQLLVYHFMFGPDWEQGCPSCSLAADTFNANLIHLTQRNISFVAVARAPIEKIESFRRRMGWKFPWVSSFGNRFNYDFGVSFTAADKQDRYNYGSMTFPSDEAPGVSAFYKNDSGELFHTYSTFGRGLEGLLGVYALMDAAPMGRDEEGLPFPMAWVRHHDRYEAKAAECCSAHGD